MLKKKLIIYSVILSLAVLMVNCSDFLTGGILDSDPNRPTEVPLLEQLVGIQPVTYGFYEGDIGIFAVMWMQQLAGVVHQYTTYEAYIINASQFDSGWQQVYQEGGLIDMNEVADSAAAKGMSTVAGIAKMHEALVVATAADVWGDMPYSEACNPEYSDPIYDKQSTVHDAVRALLDEAIADFAAAKAADEYFDSGYDFAFGGDADKWIAAAHTLKARILLNWAKVNSGNYALALAEAQKGIGSTDDNWQATHSSTTGEENILNQWDDQRSYGRVGKQIVDMLRADNDPRLEFYFEPGTYAINDTTEIDTIYGSGHVEYLEDASWLNRETLSSKGWNVDLVSWEENQFIIAECQQHAGQDAAALTTLNETQAGIETRWTDYLGGGSLPTYSALTGAALLKEIIHEKYKALYLNPQVWSDWKRTGYPVLTVSPDADNTVPPRRFLYPDTEENTNENFPGVLGLFARNENDPS